MAIAITNIIGKNINIGNQVIDKFGDYKLIDKKLDKDNMFDFEVEVEVGATFYGWLCGFGGGIKIVGPLEQKQKFKDFLSKLCGESKDELLN